MSAIDLAPFRDALVSVNDARCNAGLQPLPLQTLAEQILGYGIACELGDLKLLAERFEEVA